MTRRADELRRARIDFEEAMALGISIPELRERRKAERAAFRARAQEAVFGRTRSLMNSSLNGRSEPSQDPFSRFDAPWMHRE